MEDKIKKMVRKEVMNFVPYVSGKPIDEVKRELGIKGKVIKLASNENSIGVSKKVIQTLKKSLDGINRYPDSSSYILRKAIAKKHDLKTENIIMGSGTDEIIELIGKTFLNQGDEIVVSEHAFIRYKMAGELMGCKVVSVPMKNFTHDLKAMAKAVNGNTKVVFIANPNNPTGTYNTVEEVREFFVYIESNRLNPLVVFDEAYYEYARVQKNYPETILLLEKYPNIVILRTFSKIHSLAGLRAGYGIAAPEVISYLDRIRPPFNINLLAQIAALEALSDNAQIRESVRLVEKEKKYLYSEITKLKLNYIQSAANFILIDVSIKTGQEVFQELLKKGVIVRAMDEYGFPNHIRVTIGLTEENSIFISALKKILL